MSASQNSAAMPGGFPDQAEAIHNSEADIWAVPQTTEQMGQLGNEPPAGSRSATSPKPDDFISKPANKIVNNQQTWNGMAASTEEQNIARAVEMSLKEQDCVEARAAAREDEASRTAEANMAASPTKETPVKKKPRNYIQDMVENLALRLSNEFTPILDDQGDTLLYIGPPAKTRDQSHNEYAHIKKHFDHFYRIDSRRIKALNSERFDKLLGPNACIFAEKRLKKLEAYKKLSQEIKDATKYHMDLRPPNEDEEAVILLTELSCTQGVRSWHLAQKKYSLQTTVVMGTDQLDTEANPYYIDRMGHLKGTEDEDDLVDRPFNLEPTAIPDYSALRHHSAVERLLHAIYGDDPKLDSAPKVWTFFATAQYFRCAQHPSISKWISLWLTRGGNRNFIQNNPEVAYRIGMGIMDADLVKDAFSILVGEKALIDICSEMSGRVLASSISVHGRRQENLDDDEQNRISHAASSLLRRMTDKYRSIVVSLDWMYSSREYQKLAGVKGTTPVEEEIIREAKDLLQGFVKGRFLKIVRMGLASTFSELDLALYDTATFRHGAILAFDSTYSQLHQEARPFTRSFWIALSRARFLEGSCNTNTTHISELKNVDSNSYFENIKIIKREVVNSVILDVNKLLARQEADMLLSIRSGPASQQSRMNDHTIVAEALSSVQEVTHGPLVEPLIDSPKRASNNSGALHTSAGKRRKTMDKDAEAFTLPFRPVGTSTSVEIPSSQNIRTVQQDNGPIFSRKFKDVPRNPFYFDEEEEEEEEDEFDGGMFSMADITNQQDHAMPEPSANHYTPLPPPAVRQQLRAMNPSVESNSSSNQWTAYVRDFDPESGLPVFKLKTVDDIPPVVPQGPNGNEKESAPDADPNWCYDRSTRTWILPNKQQNFPRVAHFPCQWQDPTPASVGQASEHRPMQQFSNSNTPMRDSPQSHRYGNRPGKVAIPREKAHNLSKVDVDPYLTHSLHPINPDTILEELSAALIRQCDEIIYPPHLFHGTERLPVDLIDNLLNLDEAETKFLPLWAGGYDDGTGGVFDDMDVPNLEAGGFKGGKRGISNVNGMNGMNGEGSVSGSESSFDDIASDAVSTVGKASKAATDGTQTVRSMSENGDSESDSGFMNQDEVYEAIQELRMEEIRKGKMKAVDQNDFDIEDDDGDVSTIQGTGSDVQGDFFGEDDQDGEDAGSSFDNDAYDDDETIDIKGKGKAVDSDDDMDMEIIDKDDL